MKDYIKHVSKNCIICDEVYQYDSRQKVSKYCSKRCRASAQKQKKIKGIEGIDYVVCKICNLKYKEINHDHLSIHNITCVEYDLKYSSERTSERTRKKKDTLSSIMTSELSKKLSSSHKLENFIEKYGEEEGIVKYNLMIERTTYTKNLKYYIDKWGESEGQRIFREIQDKKGMTIKNLINKYGEEVGKMKYNKWKEKQKNKNTLPYFMELYGDDEGLKKWTNKNNNISIANSIISVSERSAFKNYLYEVSKFTRISLNMNKLENIELRGHKEGYDLDHVFSVIDGFRNNIPPHIIGHVSNLRIVESSYNRKKQHNSDTSIESIVEEYNKDKDYKNLINNIKNGNNR